MATQFCSQHLAKFSKLVLFAGTFMLTICVFHLAFFLVTTLGNLLVVRALWKASSIPANMKKLFLSLTCSDLAVGLFGQLMFGVIIAVMLKMAGNANYTFDFLCPKILTVYFFSFFLACASFLSVTAIAVDRLLAISLHLRYAELATSKRVILTLVTLWLTSGVAASIFISFPNKSGIVTAMIEFVGLLLITLANIRIYKAVRHHQNQMHCQIPLPNVQAGELLRQKKSAVTALFVFVVFLACYLPHLCLRILLMFEGQGISFLVAEAVSVFLVFLNSSLNPLIYFWRYREIREIAINTVRNIFRMNSSDT